MPGSKVFSAQCTCTQLILIMTVMMKMLVREASCCYVFPSDMKDPCQDVLCSFGAQCVASLDGLTARCQCPERCDNFGDSVGSGPVCGSDGQDYDNACSLRKASCQQMKDIHTKYSGRCDPCNTYPCPDHQVCQLDELRQPTCRPCDVMCAPINAPVCATNGKTYSNKCIMQVEACKMQRDIRLLHEGECIPDKAGRQRRINSDYAADEGNDAEDDDVNGKNPCDTARCQEGEECHVMEGVAQCSCPRPCEAIWRPVCASDGHTYDSTCHMSRVACLDKRPLSVTYHGQCSKDSPCENYRCIYGSLCTVRNGQARCTCTFDCSEEYKPVCGSDGKTHTNECKMKMKSCEERRDISKVYQGPCDACRQTKCDHFGICETDYFGRPQCVCPVGCMKLGDEVCGSDGKTYTSECEMQRTSCEQRRAISVTHTGACIVDLCELVKCQYGAQCVDGACICGDDCAATSSPTHSSVLCASDGVTYPSLCHLKVTMCRAQRDISIAHEGPCAVASVSPVSIATKETEGGNIKQDGNATRSRSVLIESITPKTTQLPNKKATPISIVATVTTATVSIRQDNDEDSLGSGDSGSGVNVCDDVTCRFEGTCEFSGTAVECVCKFYCDNAPSSPVCGSDGRVYDNDCVMKAESCLQQKPISSRPLTACSPGVSQETGVSGVQQQVTGDCTRSRYGCCQDGITPSPGFNFAGCPEMCQCHPLGSLTATCNPETRQCTCRPGTGGLRCDRCEAGFWGLTLIGEGHEGCTACSCNEYGSLRDDCDQTTGTCKCRPGVTGDRCDTCTDGTPVTSAGCLAQSQMSLLSRTCTEIVCRWGATCRVMRGVAYCLCPTSCPVNNMTSSAVCASDNVTYASLCDVSVAACRQHRDLDIVHEGPCDNTPAFAPAPTPVPGKSKANPCDKKPCHQDARCRPTRLGGFKCMCPPGKTGKLCNRDRA